MPHIIEISEKRKEELKEIQKQLRELDASIQDILDKKSSMKNLAEKYNRTPQELNSAVNKGTPTLLKRVRILNDDDITELLRDSRSPGEKLVHAMLCHHNDDMIILDIAEEEKIIELIENHLTKRECEVIKRRFGFYDDEINTLEEIGVLFNVSRDRIRQIEVKALRKLRYPSILKFLLPNYELRIQTLVEHETMLKLENELESREETILNTNKQSYRDLSKMDIYDLELSVRTYNCLKRAGYHTVEDVSRLSLEKLSRVRNLGRKSMKEIVDKLDSLGIVLVSDEISINNPSILSSLHLSKTAADKLRLIGINTISYLSKLTTSDLLNRMQCKYVKEIAKELEDKYGIKLVDDVNVLHDYTDNQSIIFNDNIPVLFKFDYEEQAPIEALRLPTPINSLLFEAGIDTIDKLVKAGPRLSEVTKIEFSDFGLIRNAVYNRYGGTFKLG